MLFSTDEDRRLDPEQTHYAPLTAPEGSERRFAVEIDYEFSGRLNVESRWFPEAQ
ncbi:MAG: hypothetical protein J4F35_12970 [Candidatus Latescibacteria bacterium]|nr:hypothetical protein [Candidatus Latescibacterota bacterium]